MQTRIGLFLFRLRTRFGRAQQEGWGATGFAGLMLIGTAAIWATLLPVTIILHLAGYRRLNVLCGRIGHLAAEVDTFLKERELGAFPSHRRYFLAIPADQVANRHMLGYWGQHLPVISHPLLARFVHAMSRWLFMRQNFDRYLMRLNETAEIFGVNARWAGRPPILSLSESDKEWGKQQFRELGIPAGAWFVCIHVREPGYSPGDEAVHAHRNGSIQAILPAMQEIARRGGWCVRVGDPTMSPLPGCENAIDYAHHPLRSARLDVVLCASCRFFLGNTSGLTFVSAAFGVPSALANMVPTSAMGLLPEDLSIPKLLWSLREGRYLGWEEIMNSPISNFRYAGLFADAGIRVDENTPEDIADLVLEMLDRLAGTFLAREDDRRRVAAFKALMKPGHYSYGTPAQVAATFLRKHDDVLLRRH